MPQKVFHITDVGDVVVSKRRGSKNFRISINPSGLVRVSMPQWVPYAAGVTFAKSKVDWINRHLDSIGSTVLSDGCLIGRHHELKFLATASTSPLLRTRVIKNKIIISTNLPWNSTNVQQSALKACERALKKEAKQILHQRVRELANSHGFEYSQVKISRLSSRWGSCSGKGVITLSYFLIQTPQEVIDYVILHELVHTQHLHHGKAFWDALIQLVPSARQMKKNIHAYKPRVEPRTTVAIS